MRLRVQFRLSLSINARESMPSPVSVLGPVLNENVYKSFRWSCEEVKELLFYMESVLKIEAVTSFFIR